MGFEISEINGEAARFGSPINTGSLLLSHCEGPAKESDTRDIS